MYSQAHLFVAAVRVFEHLHLQPPSLRAMSDLLKVSEEELSRISRRLEELGVIVVVAGGGEARFTVGDHTRIEEIPKSVEAPRMEEEITRFKSRQESRLKDLEESLTRKGDKKSVFTELEKALKDPSLMKKKNPLD